MGFSSYPDNTIASPLAIANGGTNASTAAAALSNLGAVATTSILRAEVTANVTNITNTMANLTDLTVTLAAAGVYVGEMVLKCSNSTAAEGIAVDFDGGASTMTAFAAGAGVLTGGTTVAVTTVSSAIATDFDWSTITGETWITFRIGCTVNAGGTLIPRFRESTAHSTGIATIFQGSYLLLTKV